MFTHDGVEDEDACGGVDGEGKFKECSRPSLVRASSSATIRWLIPHLPTYGTLVQRAARGSISINARIHSRQPGAKIVAETQRVPDLGVCCRQVDSDGFAQLRVICEMRRKATQMETHLARAHDDRWALGPRNSWRVPCYMQREVVA